MTTLLVEDGLEGDGVGVILAEVVVVVVATGVVEVVEADDVVALGEELEVGVAL